MLKSPGSGPSHGHGCGSSRGDGLSSGGGSREGSPSAEKGKMKARRGGDGGRDTGECSDAEVLRSFLVPLRPYWNVEFPPGVHAQYGQSDRLEIASSDRTLGDDTPAIDTNLNNDNSTSETGGSKHSSMQP